MVLSLMQSVMLQMIKNPMAAVCVVCATTDGQERHGGHTVVVGGSTDGQEPHSEHPVAVAGSADGQEPHAGLLVQSVWLLMTRNPMVDTL